MKVFRRIGVSVLVVFLTIGLCYCEAWGLFDKARAVFHYNKGHSYQEKGQWDKAIAEYNEAIKLDPKFAEAYMTRGNVYIQKDQFDQAFSDFNKALEINPKLAGAYMIRAMAYWYNGEYDKAWEDAHNAQSLGGQVNPVFLENLQNLLQSSGRQR